MRTTVLTLFLLAVPTLGTSAMAGPSGGCCGKCDHAKDTRAARELARQTAETHTGGQVVSQKRARINGSTVWGYEVDVHMPGQEKGWRCLVDMDNPPKVYSKSAIPNPPAPKKKGFRSGA